MNTMTEVKNLAAQSGKVRMTPSEAFVETLVAQGVKDFVHRFFDERRRVVDNGVIEPGREANLQLFHLLLDRTGRFEEPQHVGMAHEVKAGERRGFYRHELEKIPLRHERD